MKSDEWREHIISEKHLELQEQNDCGVCHMQHDIHSEHNSDDPNRSQIRNRNCERSLSPKYRDLHKNNRERLEF